MSRIVVPQIEYIKGATPQESVALFNAKIVELRFNNPSFERDGIGFWITYDKEIDKESKGTENTDRRPNYSAHDDYPRCSECPRVERVDDCVKWGRCTKYGGASVNLNKRVCTTYWNDLGGDESNA